MVSSWGRNAMLNVKSPIYVAIFFIAGLVDASCDMKIEGIDIFPYYEEFSGAYWVRINSDHNGLGLQEVSLITSGEDGKEVSYLVEIPLWIEPMETQPFKINKGLQKVELSAIYSDGCNTVKYRQQFQDELTSLGLDTLSIHWAGAGFRRFFSCFTGREDEGVIVDLQF